MQKLCTNALTSQKESMLLRVCFHGIILNHKIHSLSLLISITNIEHAGITLTLLLLDCFFLNVNFTVLRSSLNRKHEADKNTELFISHLCVLISIQRVAASVSTESTKLSNFPYSQHLCRKNMSCFGLSSRY